MKKAIWIFVLTVGLNTELISQSGWFELSNPTIQPYFGVYFLDADNGFICGAEGMILRTTNGGANWDSTTLDHNILFYKIKFKDSKTGFVVGSFGVIYKTENAGDTWTQVLPPDGSLHLYDIFFLDNNYGMIVGKRGISLDTALIMRTTNGGETWPILETPFPHILNAIHFYNYFDGFAVGINNLRLKTINSGQNWSQLPATQPQLLFDVFATSSINVFAVSTGGIYLSTDAGDSWSFNFPAGYMNTIFFQNSSTGFAAGREGKIWKTNNAGSSWLNQYFDLTEEFMDIYFVDNNIGYAVGNKNNEGIIYKTTTGGETFTGVDPGSEQFPEEFVLYQNYPNPFNPLTTIRYSIPTTPASPPLLGKEGIEGMFVTLKVYDVLGNEIATLVNEEKPAGNYEAEFYARSLSSGIYFYKLQAGSLVEAMKMILLK